MEVIGKNVNTRACPECWHFDLLPTWEVNIFYIISTTLCDNMICRGWQYDHFPWSVTLEGDNMIILPDLSPSRVTDQGEWSYW